MTSEFHTIVDDLELTINPLKEIGLKGSPDISSLVRNLLNEGITRYCQTHNCSRREFAEAFQKRTNSNITEHHFNKWTRDADRWKFPVEYVHHFCELTQDNRLARLAPILLNLKIMESDRSLKIKLDKANTLMSTLHKYIITLESQLQGLPTKDKGKGIFIDTLTRDEQ